MLTVWRAHPHPRVRMFALLAVFRKKPPLCRRVGASAPQLQAIASMAFSQENDGRVGSNYWHYQRVRTQTQILIS